MNGTLRIVAVCPVDKLIEMRLSSMADAFRIQMNDPAMKEVPFEDRFGMLVDVEYTNRKNNRLKRLIRQAELEQPDASIAAIDYQSGRKLNKDLISRLATCEYITEYLKWFEDMFDPNEWVECNQIICRALDISKRLGKPTQEYKQVRKTINSAIYELNGTDPLFLSINLIQLVFSDASREETEKYLQIVNKIVQQRINERNKNIFLVEKAFSVQKNY